jgi:hypothetical protein
LSLLSAPGPDVPPCRRTSLEFTTPRDVFVRIEGSAAFGAFDLRTTVYLPRDDTVTPSSRNDGLPLRLMSRLNEKTASAAVSGVPSAKCTFRRRLKTNVFASFDAVHDCTRSGRGCARSPPL